MEDVPGAGVGVGPGVRFEPPPPQPVERVSAAITMHANKNLITGANECWGVWYFILYVFSWATKFCRGSLLSLPSDLNFVFWLCDSRHASTGTTF
jgi:hypothetical protein